MALIVDIGRGKGSYSTWILSKSRYCQFGLWSFPLFPLYPLNHLTHSVPVYINPISWPRQRQIKDDIPLLFRLTCSRFRRQFEEQSEVPRYWLSSWGRVLSLLSTVHTHTPLFLLLRPNPFNDDGHTIRKHPSTNAI
jgi:hypothetical protein